MNFLTISSLFSKFHLRKDSILSFLSHLVLIVLCGHISLGKEILQKLAFENDPDSQFLLGNLYANGSKKDLHKAFIWMEKSAKQGNASACRYVARAYWQGRGISVDLKMAENWFLQAVKAGDMNALRELSILHESKKAYLPALAYLSLYEDFRSGSIDNNQDYERIKARLSDLSNLEELEKVVSEIHKKIDALPKSSPNYPVKKEKNIGEITLDDGSSYRGEILGQKPHGFGKKITPNGSSYIGNFHKGIEHGQGVSYGSDGRISYEGMWKNGKPHKM